MKIGLTLPQNDIDPDPATMVRIVRAVEDAGCFSFLSIHDHVLGADPSVRPGWDRPYDLHDPFHESLVFYGYLAALTNLELATGILILPQRQTALVAKQAAEVDILTGGRFRLGVAVGWNEVEFEALGVDFRSRGERLEEQIEVLRLLWTEASVTYEGKYHRIDHAGILPRPIQSPVPIWLGGGSTPKVLDRIGRLADGWMCMRLPDNELDAAVAMVRSAAERAGRGDRFGLQGNLYVGLPIDASSFERGLDRWLKLEATHVTINGLKMGRNLDDYLEMIAFVGSVLGDRFAVQG